MSKEENVSESSLKEAFEKQFAKGEEKQKALLLEQVQLNETRETEKELQSKLTVAVQYLENAHQQLTERSKSLRLFANRLGARPLPNSKESIALLQADNTTASKKSHKHATETSEKPGLLPDVGDVLKQPEQVFKSMNTQ